MSTPARDGRLLPPLSAGRGIALLRVAFIPVAIAQAPNADLRLEPDLFPYILGVFALYAVAMLVISGRGEGASGWRHPLAQALADLAFIAALVYTTGGARSPLRFAFFVMPVGAAVRLSPRLTAAWAALAIGAYLVVALPHPSTQLPADFDLLLGEGLALAWVSAAAVMLSALVGRRERNLAALAAARRRLVQQSLDAEARERRRLAQALHDDAIQNVLVARQEVADVARGVPGAVERAQEALDETQRQLREEVFAMHPVGLERAGLGAVLRSLAADAGRRGGFETSVDVDPEAEGVRDDLLTSTARELLMNAAKYSHADNVEVRVAAERGAVRLTVADDGAGFPAGRLEQALATGHIGLAATTERVRAVGGDVEIDSREGRGTRISVTVPGPGA